MAYELTDIDDFLTALQKGRILENEEISLSDDLDVMTAIQAIATAFDYYYQTRAKGLFVLASLNPSQLEKSECEEPKPASAAGTAKTIFFKEAQEPNEEPNLKPQHQKRLSS